MSSVCALPVSTYLPLLPVLVDSLCPPGEGQYWTRKGGGRG